MTFEPRNKIPAWQLLLLLLLPAGACFGGTCERLSPLRLCMPALGRYGHLALSLHTRDCNQIQL